MKIKILKQETIRCDASTPKECPITIHLIEIAEAKWCAARFLATWTRAYIDPEEALPGSGSLIPRSEFYASAKCAQPWGERCRANFYPVSTRQQAESKYTKMLEAAKSGKIKFELKQEIWL